MAGARSVSYEVYYLQYGRWQIHHRYGFSDREAAIDDAKRLDAQGHFDASCVVRESYDAGSGTATEAVIYHSPKLKTKPPVAYITAGQDGAAAASTSSTARQPLKNAPPGSAAANAALEARRRAEKQNLETARRKAVQGKEPSLRTPPKKGKQVEDGLDWTTAVPKLILAFVFACLAGTLTGLLCYYAIRFAGVVGLHFDGRINQILVLGSWFAGWAVCFVPMLRRVLNLSKSVITDHKQQKLSSGSDASPTAYAGTGSQGDEEGRGSKSASFSDMEPVPEEPDRALPIPDLDDLAPMGDSSDEGDGDTEESKSEEKPDPQTGGDEKTFKEEIRKFTDQMQSVVGAAMVTDQFLRFGAILFISGVADALGKLYKVDKHELTKTLANEICQLGVSDNMALGFAANIDEYLLDERYNKMYMAGSSAAVTGAVGESAMRAFREWQKPKTVVDPDKASDPKHYDETTGAEEGSHKFVAVLFTDIVNSTQQLSAKGDDWLMNVVRAHNDIIREAIGKHGGREIKHTGDGIMASFPAVASSVAAGFAMQIGVRRFSKAMPSFAFELCVGISAGEPIHESGDLFGTPVNLAARVLSKAKPNDIAVSNIVRDMCRGKSFAFEELGRFDLKGFEEPQPIYRVLDRRDAIRDDDPKTDVSAAAG